MDDFDRENRIVELVKLIGKEKSRSRKRLLWLEMQHFISQRSPEQVKKMEEEKGLLRG